MAILTGNHFLRFSSFIRFLLVTCVGCFSIVVNADEKSLQLYEQKIKAGLVYNLLKYTQWSDESSTIKQKKLQICLYTQDPFEGYLSPLDGRTLQQLSIAISIIKTPTETFDCSVVIVHRNQMANLPDLLTVLNGKNILTISDAKDFAQAGGMIELSKENEKISITINTATVKHAGLVIQDPMLKLARLLPPGSVEK